MTIAPDIVIVPISDEHIEGYNRCVTIVARERRYIGLVEAPTLEQSRQFFERLRAGGGVSNHAAIALYERLGFVREGLQRRARYPDGQYDDNVLMALLPDRARGAP